MHKIRPHILVVDDDAKLRKLLSRYLVGNGHLVCSAANARSARARLTRLAFDLVVLDVMMPGEDGLSLARHIRSQSNLPILLLTARGEVEDRIVGLEAGGDDYLTKPFEPRELLLRVAAILRRAPVQSQTTSGRILQIGRWRFQPDMDHLQDGQETVPLTPVEANLLHSLAENPGTILSRETLSERSRIRGGVRTVDVQITRLRRKLGDDPRAPRHICTVRGEGYVLKLNPYG